MKAWWEQAGCGGLGLLCVSRGRRREQPKLLGREWGQAWMWTGGLGQWGPKWGAVLGRSRTCGGEGASPC